MNVMCIFRFVLIEISIIFKQLNLLLNLIVIFIVCVVIVVQFYMYMYFKDEF